MKIVKMMTIVFIIITITTIITSQTLTFDAILRVVAGIKRVCVPHHGQSLKAE